MKIDVERVMSNSRNIDNMITEDVNIHIMMSSLEKKSKLVPSAM